MGEGDFTVLEESRADDFVSHNTAASEDVEGIEAYEGLIEVFRSEIPDLTVEVIESFAGGDRMALRFSMRGTHQGELMGVAPTGTEVGGEGLAIAHFSDGEVVEV